MRCASRFSLDHHLIRLLPAFVLAVVCFSGVGCGSTYASLGSERDFQITASLMAAHDQLNYRTTLHETTRDGEPSIQVAIHETGPGDAPLKLVFIHGVFADSNSWRYIAPGLTDLGDLWLIDSPGCGASGAPDPEDLKGDGYAPVALAHRTLQALEHRLAQEPQSTRLVLVAHSLGGAVAIRMLSDPDLAARFSAVLSRLDLAVLLAPLHVVQNNAHDEIIRLATVSGFTIGLGDLFGIVRERCALNTIRGMGDPRFAVQEEALKRYEILMDTPRRRAMQSQLVQAVAWDKNFLPDWEEMERQIANYHYYKTATLIIWGAYDEVQPVSTGHLLEDALPGAQLIVVPGVKHSVHLERPRWTTHAIRSFINDSEIVAPPDEAWGAQP